MCSVNNVFRVVYLKSFLNDDKVWPWQKINAKNEQKMRQIDQAVHELLSDIVRDKEKLLVHVT